MAETTIYSGTDAWFERLPPESNHSSGGAVKIQSGERRAAIHLPIADIRGRTVLNAYLTMHARGSNPSQTITAKLPEDGWSASAINWGNQPLTLVTQATAIAATADGDSVNVGITTLLAQVALGHKWRGLILTSTVTAVGDSNWYSFDSGQPAWSITIELSDAPAQPTGLRPDAGAVSTGKPILSWDDVDLPGDSSAQASFLVQIDPGMDGASPAWSSGVLTGPSELDLTLGSYPGLASGATTFWRVQTYDANGRPSIWSDWATFTYTPKPTLVLDSPTGGNIGDPTFSVLAHLGSGTLRRSRVRLTKGNDRSAVLYDSGDRPPDAGTIALMIPYRDEDGRKIIRRDVETLQLNVRAWDTVNRAPSTGSPAYVETWVTLTFVAGSNAVPGAFSASQVIPGDPRLTFSFTRTEAPEAITIHTSDGKLYARVPIEDITVSAGTYTWRDHAETDPYVSTTFTARAIDAGSRSNQSGTATVTVKPIGVWLFPEDDSQPIRMRGRGVGEFTREDRRARFQPLSVDHPVDIVYGRNGISGDWAGTIDAYQPTTASVLDAVARLEAIFDNPAARPRMVWATKSATVSLSAASVVPADEFLEDSKIHNVRFHLEEVPGA